MWRQSTIAGVEERMKLLLSRAGWNTEEWTVSKLEKFRHEFRKPSKTSSQFSTIRFFKALPAGNGAGFKFRLWVENPQKFYLKPYSRFLSEKCLQKGEILTSRERLKLEFSIQKMTRRGNYDEIGPYPNCCPWWWSCRITAYELEDIAFPSQAKIRSGRGQ